MIMIDDKKIEEAAKVYMIGELYDKDKAEWDYPITNEEIRNQSIRDFKEGAKWAINEFIKDLWHPISEKPRRNTICLAQIRKYVFNTFYDSENWEYTLKVLISLVGYMSMI